MIGIKDFGLFITLSWALIVSPGPDIIYVITRSISLGRKAGILSSFGVTLGILIHTLFAAFGLSVILKTSGMAFLGVKYIGAAYLIYLGIRNILEGKKVKPEKEKFVNNNKIFIQGFLSNVFNPKVALFFMAFLPQFVDINNKTNSMLTLMVLGLIFAFCGLVFLLLIGHFSGYFGKYLLKNTKISQRLQYLSGLILIALGIRLSFLKRN